MYPQKNDIRENIKKKIFFDLIIAFAFSFNICIFAPIEFYYLNVFDLWFTVDNVLPFCIIAFSLSYLIICCICIISRGKIHDIISRIIFAIFIGLYVQGNFLNFGYNVLDGNEVNWDPMFFKGIINTVIWIIILILPFAVKKLKDKTLFRKCAIIVSFFIMLIQISTLVVIIYTGAFMGEDNNDDLDKSFYLDTTNMFNLSKEDNIIIFVSDSFEATYMNELLNENPNLKDSLKDFTYFENTTGASLKTFTSMPTILTGESCSIDKNLKENMKDCFEQSKLYSVLKENKYDIELYTDSYLIPYDDNNIISNKIDEKLMLDINGKCKASGLLFECVFYKYLPHFLKKNFMVASSEFNKVTTQNVNQYVLDDVAFYNELTLNGITSKNPNKTYKLIHMNGIHGPYIINQDIEYDLSEEYQSKFNSQKRKNQTIASVKILLKYLEELKKSELYNNTTIILLADHGVENKYHINFLIKNANEEKEFSISDAPIAITEDFVPTILNIATKTKDYGQDIWDYKDDDIRERYLYDYEYKRNANTYNVLHKEKIITNAHASELNEYHVAHEENIDVDTKLIEEYKFGEKINILKNQNMEYIILDKILQTELRNVPKGTNISNKANMLIKTPKTDEDVIAQMLIGDAYFDNQEIQIYYKDKILYKEKINKGERKKVKFTISKEIWNTDELLELELRFPNGKLETSERSGNATLFLSMVIEEITFEN